MERMRWLSFQRRTITVIVAVSLVLWGSWACGPGETGKEAVTEAGSKEASGKEVSTDDASPQETTEEAKPEKVLPPLDLSERVSDGTARAGIIRDAKEYIGGPNANGRERVGDIKIYNSKVAFTIAGARWTHGYLSLGGKIVAADIIRKEGEPGRSLFQEFSLAFQHRMMKPERIEIVNDGRDGKAAVVRIVGKDNELSLLLSYIKAFSAALAKETFELGFEITNEFRLEPNSSILQMKTTILNQAPRFRDINFSEVGFFMGDGLHNFFPRKGEVDGKDALGLWKYHGLMSKDVGYVVFPKEGEDFQMLVKFKTVLIGTQNIFSIKSGETYELSWNVAVGKDLAAAQAAYRTTLKDIKTGSVKGKVQLGDGSPVAGVILHIEQTNKDNNVEYVGQAVSQRDGSYSINLPVGTYTLKPERAESLGKSVEIEIKEGSETEQTVTAPDAGTLTVVATEEDGSTPLPVKVSATLQSQGVTRVPSHYGKQSYAGGAFHIFYPYTGKGSVSLPPGTYKVVVSRGFFYDYKEEVVTIEANKETKVEASLKKYVQTPNSLSGDFHVHAKGSPDSQDSNQLKLSSMVGEGLELAVSTDHEFVTDYQPFIKEMKLESRIRSVVGEEVTTHFGHFNTYPIPHKSDVVNNGAFPWYPFLAPEMFEFVVKEAPDAVVQVNHPRGAAAGSYFSYVGYNNSTGVADNKPKEWSWKFHAIEVINSNSFNTALSTTVEDWYSMLNRGFPMTAMGNSDSHRATTSECGYPRNMVMLGTNDPNKFTMKELSTTIKAQKVVVSGGAMIQFSASPDGNASSGKGLGETLTLTGDTVHLHVKVEASPWVHINKLQLIANGKVVETKDIPQKEGAVVRLDEVFQHKPDKDSWYLVMVTGTKSLSPVIPGSKPFAFTNPIYVDVDKDNKFTPPMKIEP